MVEIRFDAILPFRRRFPRRPHFRSRSPPPLLSQTINEKKTEKLVGKTLVGRKKTIIQKTIIQKTITLQKKTPRKVEIVASERERAED